MSFPPRPTTSDARRTEFLRLFAVDGYPNVFILGSHARYVTVHGQQVRALNLVSALVKNGEISRSTRVGIVGGGIAGLTAAVAAAEVGASRVLVFESEPSLIRLQRNSEKRFIHPHIYDWPRHEPAEELPIMSWEADSASSVAKRLLEELEEVRQNVGDRFPPPETSCGPIQLKSGATPTLIVNGKTHQLDLLILAVGFGRDSSASTLGYWTDDDLGATELEGGGLTWLISGAGDGALTDLMRLCILDFTHQSVLEAVDTATRDRVGNRLFEIETSNEARSAAFHKAAKEVDAELTAKLAFRNVGTIYLNCDPDSLFEGGSSILNRLITAWLQLHGCFTTIAGRITRQTKVDDKWRVEFDRREPIEVDRVVIRHGPKTPYETEEWLRPLGQATLTKRVAWKEARQFDDWTRMPLFNEEVPFQDLSRVARIDFGTRIGCVIITGDHSLEGRPIEARVEEVLQRLSRKKGTERYAPGREIDKVPVRIPVRDALSSPAQYERAVRALCEAEIAIFDLTNHESAVMLLLGIRAAVRRGVTVAVTATSVNAAPFNVASLNPVLFDHHYVENQTKSLETAFATLAEIPDYYLDLPVYDAVRTLGDDYRTRNPDEEILVLRWFDDQYSRMVGDEVIRSRLETQWDRCSVITTLDSRSPQLVEQRLYAAIRRDRVCIADWTGARPNVFFEIGVRLAVSEHDPVFILCTDPPPSRDMKSAWPREEDPWLPALERLFGLTSFSLRNDDALRKRLETYDHPLPDALLSRGRTYAVAAAAIERAREPGGESLHAWLLRNAEKLAGAAVEDGSVPVLYAETLKPQVRRAAAERTLAAWYYLTGRHKIIERMESKTISPDDPLLKAMQDVGTKFSAQARESTGELKEIADQLRPILLKITRYTMKGNRDAGRDQ